MKVIIDVLKVKGYGNNSCLPMIPVFSRFPFFSLQRKIRGETVTY